MEISEGLTFDDVLLVPAASDVVPGEVSTSVELIKGIKLNAPIMSSAMDTVTEFEMATAMAQFGGLGVIHRNMSIEEQAKLVRKVKRFESGVISNPITLREHQTVREARALQKEFNITGFPVVDDENKLVGILTNRDMRFSSDEQLKISTIMTKNNLATIDSGSDPSIAKKIMAERRVEKLPIVKKDNELIGLITIKDLEGAILNPLATKDKEGKLRVAAASTVGEEGFERSSRLIESGVDFIVIDTAHGHSDQVLKAVKLVKSNFPKAKVIAGNVATAKGTRALIEAGADSVKVGVGPGSICTTRVVSGVGVPQLTAILNCAKEAQKTGHTIIADGGIKFSGDFAKAIAAGASCIMAGSILAGTDEAPGDLILYQGRTFKAYRGMGSLGAMARGSADRYFQKEVLEEKLVPEGVEGQVPYKGPVGNVLHQMMGGLRASMGYTGVRYLEEMSSKCEFIKISNSSLEESHVHNVQVTREAPNYRGE